MEELRIPVDQFNLNTRLHEVLESSGRAATLDFYLDGTDVVIIPGSMCDNWQQSKAGLENIINGQ